MADPLGAGTRAANAGHCPASLDAEPHATAHPRCCSACRPQTTRTPCRRTLPPSGCAAWRRRLQALLMRGGKALAGHHAGQASTEVASAAAQAADRQPKATACWQALRGFPAWAAPFPDLVFSTQRHCLTRVQVVNDVAARRVAQQLAQVAAERFEQHCGRGRRPERVGQGASHPAEGPVHKAGRGRNWGRAGEAREGLPSVPAPHPAAAPWAPGQRAC